MTGRGAAILELVRQAMAAVESLDPAERDVVVETLVADLRARHPESVSLLTIGPPTEPIRDPRTA